MQEIRTRISVAKAVAILGLGVGALVAPTRGQDAASTLATPNNQQQGTAAQSSAPQKAQSVSCTAEVPPEKVLPAAYRSSTPLPHGKIRRLSRRLQRHHLVRIRWTRFGPRLYRPSARVSKTGKAGRRVRCRIKCRRANARQNSRDHRARRSIFPTGKIAAS